MHRAGRSKAPGRYPGLAQGTADPDPGGQAKALSGGSGTLVEVVFAQTGKLGKDPVRPGATAVSDATGSALSRALTLGKSRPMK